MPTGKEIIEFLSNTQHDAQGCLIWQGPVGSHSYGVARYRGQQRLAHRLSYEMVNGEIPKGLWVMHLETCSKRCVRIQHLSIGTPTQNTLSAWLAGKSNQPKLSAVDISGLKWLIAKGVSVKIATKAYGVARSYLYDRKYKVSQRSRGLVSF